MQRLAVVTGANAGIGLEVSRGLARQGFHVVMACRDTGRATRAAEDVMASVPQATVTTMRLDVADYGSVRTFAEEVRAQHDEVHVLVNNAGVYLPRRQENAAGHELTFATNHLGHFLLTRELLEPLMAGAPSRIVHVTSAVHKRGRIDLDDLHKRGSYSGVQAYADSKLAQVLFNRALARHLDGTGVVSNAAHPGGVGTGIWRGAPAFVRALIPLFTTGPAKGARTPLLLAAGDVDRSGAYWAKGQVVRENPLALDEGLQEELWRVSVELTRK